MAWPSVPSFAEAFRFWLKLGFISFGGPAGQIALMHQELVERRAWISEEEFFHALNYCMLLPGPEAQQLAIYAGWKLHGTRGGIAAGTLFVLPSAVILWALSWAYAALGALPVVVGILYGLKSAVLAIVIAAVLRLGGRVLKNLTLWALAGLAFLGLAWGHWPFPLIVLGAGVLGLIGNHFWPDEFSALKQPEPGALSGHGAPEASGWRPSGARFCKVLGAGVVLWAAPLLALALWLGSRATVFQEGLFFSKAAVVTFGGAYAVLPYVSQRAVFHYGWLESGQMLDGLGLAETTPGPLIMVLQFVGFLGGWNHPGSLSPLLAATLGAAITTWTTFVPCFIWVFLGAPYLESWRALRPLHAALTAITAAVVGVICHLAVWFGWNVLQPGSSGSFDGFAALLAAIALAGLVRWKWPVVPVVLGCALAGSLAQLFRSA